MHLKQHLKNVQESGVEIDSQALDKILQFSVCAQH